VDRYLESQREAVEKGDAPSWSIRNNISSRQMMRVSKVKLEEDRRVESSHGVSGTFYRWAATSGTVVPVPSLPLTTLPTLLKSFVSRNISTSTSNYSNNLYLWGPFLRCPVLYMGEISRYYE